MNLWHDDEDDQQPNQYCGHCGEYRRQGDWDATAVPPNGIPGEHRSCGLRYFGIRLEDGPSKPTPTVSPKEAAALAVMDIPSIQGSKCGGYRKEGRGRPGRMIPCLNCKVIWQEHD